MNKKAYTDFNNINKSRILRVIRLLKKIDHSNKTHLIYHANINRWNINELYKIRIISDQQVITPKIDNDGIKHNYIKYLIRLNKNYKINFQKWLKGDNKK